MYDDDDTEWEPSMLRSGSLSVIRVKISIIATNERFLTYLLLFGLKFGNPPITGFCFCLITD